MRRIICLILALVLCVSLAGCGGSGASKAASGKMSDQTQMYVPGTGIDTRYGSITVVDAAFCGKAQIYYTKNGITRRTTINGQTTESYEESIFPGYISSMENKVIFALKTTITNTTDKNLEIHNLEAMAYFGENEPVYFSKGGNFEISDPAYKTLPAGSSAEVIMAALVPVEQYQAVSECLLEIDGTQLGFRYDNINVYNALGYQPEDNVPVSIEDLIQGKMRENPAQTQEPAETVPETVEPEVSLIPCMELESGEWFYEGQQMSYRNVGLGFVDQLPQRLLDKFSHYAEELAMNDTQCYAVVRFTATNLTKETVDLADLHGDFMVQLNYNNGYVYNTHNDVKSIFESGGNIKMVQSGFSTGNDISVAPLASADVTVYLVCAREVAENTTNPLYLGLVSRFTGNETATFGVPRNVAWEKPAAVAPANAEYEVPFVDRGVSLANEYVEVYDCRMYDLGGITRFELDYETREGLKPCVFANFWEDNIPDYWYEAERTSGEKETLVFEMDTEVLDKSYGPDVHFRRENGDLACYVLIYNTQRGMGITDGKIIGEEIPLEVNYDGDITVHSVTVQALDNDYLRFRIDCTPPEIYSVSFFSPPDGDIFMFRKIHETKGVREIFTLDVPREDIAATPTITMGFFSPDDSGIAWIYFDSPFVP